jgi:hypothetical protein
VDNATVDTDNFVIDNRQHPAALYCSISFEVKLPSACSFIVDEQGKARKPNTHTRIWKLTETQQTNSN